MFRSALALFAALTLLPACSTVSVDEPFGDPPRQLESDDWTGHWFTGDGAVRLDIEALDGSDRLSMTVVDRDEEGDPSDPTPWKFAIDLAQPIQVQVRAVPQLDGYQALFVQRRALGWKEDEDHPDALLFMLALEHEGSLVLWSPIAESFGTDVDAGRLDGQVERNDYSAKVFLHRNAPEAFDRILAPENVWRYFDVSEPIAFVRMPEGLLSAAALAAPVASEDE